MQTPPPNHSLISSAKVRGAPPIQPGRANGAKLLQHRMAVKFASTTTKPVTVPKSSADLPYVCQRCFAKHPVTKCGSAPKSAAMGDSMLDNYLTFELLLDSFRQHEFTVHVMHLLFRKDAESCCLSLLRFLSFACGLCQPQRFQEKRLCQRCLPLLATNGLCCQLR